MKRRALIIRTLTGAVSASVFTAVGWLMGAKTLTMASGVPPTPCEGATWTEYHKLCLNANCAIGKVGNCGYDCYVFHCPEGDYAICNIGSTSTCCYHEQCPD